MRLGLQIPVRPAAPATPFFFSLPSSPNEAVNPRHDHWRIVIGTRNYSKQSDFEIRPDLERLLGSPFGEASISCRKGQLSTFSICWYQILSNLRIVLCIQYTLYKYLCQTCQSQRQKPALNRGSDLSPCIRQPESQKSDTSGNCQKRKEKINPKRDFILLFSVWVDPFFQGWSTALCLRKPLSAWLFRFILHLFYLIYSFIPFF